MKRGYEPFRIWMFLAVVLLLGIGGNHAMAQTIRIGEDAGLPGAAVEAAVTLSDATSATAVLLRLEYDATALENPSAAPGPRLTSQHALDVYLPAPGRLNVMVYAPSGALALSRASGTLLTLAFTIKSGAAPGNYPIALTTADTPGLPVSNLVQTDGTLLTHSFSGGGITVLESRTSVGDWMLYD